MLHGNPSWSYYWRHLVLGLRDRYRCIVPDHIGMGLSDKPDDAAMHRRATTTRCNRASMTSTTLLDRLGITGPVTLAVHDWGGMIGFGWALSHLPQVKRLVILNTAAFPLPAAKAMPWQLSLGRDSHVGGFLIRAFNLFARGAAWLGTERRLPAAVRRAYIAPYDGWRNAISTLRFMQDIPLREGDPAWPLVAEAGRRLHEFADRPAFIGWGLRDFVFDRHCLDGFRGAAAGRSAGVRRRQPLRAGGQARGAGAGNATFLQASPSPCRRSPHATWRMGQAHGGAPTMTP